MQLVTLLTIQQQMRDAKAKRIDQNKSLEELAVLANQEVESELNQLEQTAQSRKEQ